MEEKKKIVKSLEQMLDMLPENLTEDEKKKVGEIRGLLEKIDKKLDKENSMDR